MEEANSVQKVKTNGWKSTQLVNLAILKKSETKFKRSLQNISHHCPLTNALVTIAPTGVCRAKIGQTWERHEILGSQMVVGEKNQLLEDTDNDP